MGERPIRNLQIVRAERTFASTPSEFLKSTADAVGEAGICVRVHSCQKRADTSIGPNTSESIEDAGKVNPSRLQHLST
jgi:hypothetical protein